MGIVEIESRAVCADVRSVFCAIVVGHTTFYHHIHHHRHRHHFICSYKRDVQTHNEQTDKHDIIQGSTATLTADVLYVFSLNVRLYIFIVFLCVCVFSIVFYVFLTSVCIHVSIMSCTTCVFNKQQ